MSGARTLSLRWRIAAGLGVIAAVVAALASVTSYLSTADRLEQGVDETLLATARELDDAQDRRGANPGPANPNASVPTRPVPTTPSGATVPVAAFPAQQGGGFTRPDGCPPVGLLQPADGAQLLSAGGAVTVCIEEGLTLPVDATDRDLMGQAGETRLRTASVDGARLRIVTIGRADGSALQVARDLQEVDHVLASLRLRLGSIGLAGVAAAVGLGWLVARRVIEPVERLRVTAERIAVTQDLSTSVPVGGAAEIGSLATSFTTMVDALATSRREQQQLISDASHELRTPLTSLRTNAELLARPDRLDADQYARVLDGIQLEVGELTNLVSELVELATDRASNDEPPQAVRLRDLADDVATRARRRTSREVTVVVADERDDVDVRPLMITRAISNLVDNAVKYSPDGSPIEIVVRATTLDVRDRGTGILAEDLPHVFDRFYRSTAARTEPGSGLGLAIVRQAVERHGGTVHAANAVDGGAVIGFTLPVGADG